MKGARETISELKRRGMTVVCFSGGFRSATGYAKDILGYDADFSNVLHEKDGKLTGLVGGDMMFNYSKGDMLQRLQSILGVSEEETLDPKKLRKQYKKPRHPWQASRIIEEKDLTKILEKI